jgi:tellurite resistance protein TehA-like permease
MNKIQNKYKLIVALFISYVIESIALILIGKKMLSTTGLYLLAWIQWGLNIIISFLSYIWIDSLDRKK